MSDALKITSFMEMWGSRYRVIRRIILVLVSDARSNPRRAQGEAPAAVLVLIMATRRFSSIDESISSSFDGWRQIRSCMGLMSVS